MIAVEKCFSLRPDWHQDHRARPLVRHYQAALDSVLESHPQLQECAADCVHCGIRFLTHPRNAGRENLRCPFGCRRHHRREHASRRSAAYYRTPAGRQKKQRLNARRHRNSRPEEDERAGRDAPNALIPATNSCSGQLPEEEPSLKLEVEGVVLDESSVAKSRMLPYVRLVVSLIEGIPVSLEQLVGLLRQALRQHSIALRSRSDYVLAFLHQHPP